jgi:hypothetical protein
MEGVTHIVPAANMQEHRDLRLDRWRRQESTKVRKCRRDLSIALHSRGRNKGFGPRTGARKGVKERGERGSRKGPSTETRLRPARETGCDLEQLVSKPAREIGMHERKLRKDENRVFEPSEGRRGSKTLFEIQACCIPHLRDSLANVRIGLTVDVS